MQAIGRLRLARPWCPGQTRGCSKLRCCRRWKDCEVTSRCHQDQQAHPPPSSSLSKSRRDICTGDEHYCTLFIPSGIWAEGVIWDIFLIPNNQVQQSLAFLWNLHLNATCSLSLVLVPIEQRADARANSNLEMLEQLRALTKLLS